MDYSETLRHWAERLDANLAEGRRLAGAERLRVWRLYLRAARNGFDTKHTSIYQVRCVKSSGPQAGSSEGGSGSPKASAAPASSARSSRGTPRSRATPSTVARTAGSSRSGRASASMRACSERKPSAWTSMRPHAAMIPSAQANSP